MSTSLADPLTEAPASLGQMRRVLDALAGGQWWQPGEQDLIGVLGQIGQVRHELARVEARASGEALARGLATDRGMGAVDFLTFAASAEAPAPPPGHTAAMARLGVAVRDPAAGLATTVAGFEAGLLNTSRASAIVRFHDDVQPHSAPEPLEEAMGVINDGALDSIETDPPPGAAYDPLGRKDRDPTAPCRRRGWSDRELRTMLSRARRIIKPEEDTEADERRGRAFRTLHTLPAGADMTEYRLVVEAEAAAVIEAALSALAAPDPANADQRANDGVRGDDAQGAHNAGAGAGTRGDRASDSARAHGDGASDGEDPDPAPDTRSAPRRRADALIEIIARGVAAPQGTTQTTKAQVMVTIPYTVLLGHMPGAGITMTGQVLSPATVRRMACAAGIIPAVLGSKGEILDLGRTRRLFTPAQHRVLWHRDAMCSFPGCTIPPQWCDAHHITHWAHGGATDLDNAALLCPRHHTYVHTHDLTATITNTGVTWHT